jgi:hypothetical protein
MLLTGFACRGFHLSDPVLIAVATTTTANLIGTLLVVAKYLFPGANQTPDTKAPG